MSLSIRGVFRNCVKVFTVKMRLCRRKISLTSLKVYSSVFFMMFASAFSITVLFPFLPFMVKFLVEVDEINVGKYVGIVPTAMFVGRFLGSYVWGSIADQVGRKPVVIVSVFLVGLSSGAFGFSVTFGMAVFLRFLVGLFNGLPGTAKAMLSETSSNKSQATGMAVFSTGWGLGLVTGSAVGGLLAVSNPVRTTVTNTTFGNESLSSPTFLELFPYSPPCLVNAGICFLAMIIAIFLLPETLQSKKKKSKSSNVEDNIELEPLATSESSSDDEDTENGITIHDNVTCVTSEQDDSGRGSGENTSSSSTDTSQSIEGEDKPSPNTEEYDGADSYHSNQETPPTNSSDEVLVPDGTDSSVDRLHVVPFTVDRSNSSHLNYFSGSVEHLLEEVGRSRRSSITASLRRRRDSIQTTLDHEDCCLCCCQSCPKLRSWSRKLLVGLKKSIKNMYYFTKDPTSRKTIMIYSTLSIAVIGFDEMYSVFCKTSPKLGGLGLTQNEIGVSLTIIGAMMVPLMLFLFPLLEKKIGSKKSFQYMCILAMVATLLMPTLNAAALQDNKAVLWAFLILLMLCIRTGIAVCIAAGSLFVNNSVYFHQLASVNGFSMTVTSVTRMIAPVVAGSLWSASLTENSRKIGFPFDYHLIFILCGIVYLCCMIIVAMLPKSIDQQKKVPTEQVEQLPPSNTEENGDRENQV